MACGTWQRGYHSPSGIPDARVSLQRLQGLFFRFAEVSDFSRHESALLQISTISSYFIAVENFGLQYVESVIPQRVRSFKRMHGEPVPIALQREMVCLESVSIMPGITLRSSGTPSTLSRCCVRVALGNSRNEMRGCSGPASKSTHGCADARQHAERNPGVTSVDQWRSDRRFFLPTRLLHPHHLVGTEFHKGRNRRCRGFIAYAHVSRSVKTESQRKLKGSLI
jgi:hypothetical protein